MKMVREEQIPCKKCGQNMLALFTSYTCLQCDEPGGQGFVSGSHSEVTWNYGYIVTGLEPRRNVNHKRPIFPTKEMAEERDSVRKGRCSVYKVKYPGVISYVRSNDEYDYDMAKRYRIKEVIHETADATFVMKSV